MNVTRRRAVKGLELTLLILALVGCDSVSFPLTTAYPSLPQPAYSAAQATLSAGQSQMLELSYQATSIGLEIAQAADATAKSELDDYQRRMMELAYQSTLVSQNIAQAAATQQFIREQTQMALDANATSQSSGATAIHSAYVLNATQTAQSAQGIATQRAYILTATPLAALQDSIARTQNKANRTALWNEFVIVPLKVILSTLVILLLILGGVLAYRRLMPVLELRLRTISRGNSRKPLILLDGMSRDPGPVRLTSFPKQPGQIHPARLLSDQTTLQVEIVRPSEPVVAGWIAEAEQKLRGSGDDTQ